MKDLDDLMKQAQGMQQKLQEAGARLGETIIQGAAGAVLSQSLLKDRGIW